MDVASSLNALRADARHGALFPQWYCISSANEQMQVRDYVQTSVPFWRQNTDGSTLTVPVLGFTLPESRHSSPSEASCNAIGLALLEQLGLGWTAGRMGLRDKDSRLPYYMDMLCAEIVILDHADGLTNTGPRGPRVRQREAAWLHQLFHRPSYERADPLTRILGEKTGMSLPVIVLCTEQTCDLLNTAGMAFPRGQVITVQHAPEAVDDYGALTPARTLTFADLNHPRAYLRLPYLEHALITFEAFASDYHGEPHFGIAFWEDTRYFFMAMEYAMTMEGHIGSATRFILLEATPEQLAASIQRRHHLHPSEIRHNRVVGWFTA